MQRIRFAYFGYSVEFSSETVNVNTLRSEANAYTIAAHGEAPKLCYVEPMLPFPDYVPAYVLTSEGWHPY